MKDVKLDLWYYLNESQCGIGYNVVQFLLDAITVLTFSLSEYIKKDNICDLRSIPVLKKVGTL